MSDTTRPAAIGTEEVIAHLWRRRYVLVVVPLLFTILTFAYVFIRMGESFSSRATLMVRSSPGSMREGPRLLDLNPPAYSDFLLSDEILYGALNSVKKEHPEYVGRLEDLKKEFKVKTVLTRETVTSTEYSPILILTANGPSPKIAHRLAEEWMNLSIARFGQMRSNEAGQMRKVMAEQFDLLAAEAEKLDKRQATLQNQITDMDTFIAVKRRILAGTGAAKLVFEKGKDNKNETATSYEDLGLVHERTMLELDLAQLEKANPDQTAPAAGLRARIAKIDEIVPGIIKEVEEIGVRKTELVKDLEAVREQLLTVKGRLDTTRDVVASVSPEMSVIADPANPEVSGIFSIIARPMEPDKKDGPPRTLISLGAGTAMAALLMLLMILELYIQHAVGRRL
jgi:uncharacterized protein involved in exopolysaccharide biosynthesis